MPTSKELLSLRRQLLERRHRLVEAHQNTNRDIAQLQDAPKDAELEETAQTSLAEYTLQQLTDVQRREVIQLDAALARMDAGQFGRCEECGGTISVKRLQALPFATRCTDCAQEHEQARGQGILSVPGTL
ncbi:MAG: TraR/DksA family transcriptional regulator [Deltaproteobacteria bacterium]